MYVGDKLKGIILYIIGVVGTFTAIIFLCMSTKGFSLAMISVGVIVIISLITLAIIAITAIKLLGLIEMIMLYAKRKLIVSNWHRIGER